MSSASQKTKQLRFYNPLAGRPKAINLSSLLLINPFCLTKLMGASQSSIFTELGGEKTRKKMERIFSGQQQATSKSLSDLIALLPKGRPYVNLLELALAGDYSAQQHIEEIGHWESFFIGVRLEDEPLSEKQQFIVNIERASRQPQKLMEQGAFSEAASLLAGDNLLSLYFWPEAITLVESAESLGSLMPLRASLALEVMLSILAAMDIETLEPDSAVQCVMPSIAHPGNNPTKLFFTYLLEESGVKTIKGLLEDKRLNKLSLNETTLKRWNSGACHPEESWLKPVVEALWGDANHPPVWNRYWAAKYLNFIGHLGQSISEQAQIRVGTTKEQAMRPWPCYPFGYSSIEDWLQARYQVWRDYHLHREEHRTEMGTANAAP